MMICKKIFFFICALLFVSCNVSKDKMTKKEHLMRNSAIALQNEVLEIQKKQQLAVDSYIENLPVAQKISQLFLVNIVASDTFLPVEHTGALTDEYGKGSYLVPGGCIYFSYNIASSAEEMIAFNDSVRDFCVENNIVPPFLSLDQEGGLVSRLRRMAGPLPSNKRVVECLTVDQAYRLYFLQGIQMRALGFHLNLSPVVEVETEDNKDFLGERSYGSVEKVLSYGTAAVNGFENAGVGAVLKHFPGNTNSDPHTLLPEILWSEEQLELNVISPFSRFTSINPSGVLMSHARTKAFDPNTPACLSSYWVTDILIKKLEYDGIVFSDDIFMDALQKNGFPPEQASVMAINAGVDCIMLSEKRFASVAKNLLEYVSKDDDFAKKIDKSVKKIINWKIQHNILNLEMDSNNNWIVSVPEKQSIDERLNVFLSALTENINIYRDFFTQ